MALASGSTPEGFDSFKKTFPRCCDSALAYNDALAQQEPLQQVARELRGHVEGAAAASNDASY